MTEGERVALYNAICDWKDALMEITYPPQTQKIDILNRTASYLRGTTATWSPTDASETITTQGRRPIVTRCLCSRCGFSRGESDFKYCPNCMSRMKKT